MDNVISTEIHVQFNDNIKIDNSKEVYNDKKNEY